jgi:hypothetical protein
MWAGGFISAGKFAMGAADICAGSTLVRVDDAEFE